MKTLPMAVWEFRPNLVGNSTILARFVECNTASSCLLLLSIRLFTFTSPHMAILYLLL